MVPIRPIESVIKDMIIPDLKEHWAKWLKFLFIESPLGWIGLGLVMVELFMITCTILYWL